MLYAILVEGQGPLGIDLQPRRLHRPGGPGHRRRRPARVRRRLGRAAPVLPLADPLTTPTSSAASSSRSPARARRRSPSASPTTPSSSTCEQDTLDANQQLVTGVVEPHTGVCVLRELFPHPPRADQPHRPEQCQSLGPVDQHRSLHAFPPAGLLHEIPDLDGWPNSQSGIWQAFTAQPTEQPANIALLIQEGYACQFDRSVITAAGIAVTRNCRLELRTRGTTTSPTITSWHPGEDPMMRLPAPSIDPAGGLHPGRAAGRDPDHRPRQRGDAAGRPARAEPPRGERGGPHPPGGAGWRARPRHPLQRTTRAPIPARPGPDGPAPGDPTISYTANPPVFPGSSTLAYNRFVPIEPAPDYSEGHVTLNIAPAGFTTQYFKPDPLLNYPAGNFLMI